MTVHSQTERALPAQPLLPRSRPARSHSALPHVAAKLHTSPPRGGAPYALGPASLSLGLWSERDPMPAHHNELISNPSSGILKGRSPPRGDPPSAFLLPRPARALTFHRAPLNPIHRIALVTPRRRTALPHAEACPGIADAGVIVVSPRVNPMNTPDRAFEGRPAGPYLPSWRCIT